MLTPVLNPAQLYDVANKREGTLEQLPFAVLLHALAVFEKTATVEFERR